MSMLVICFCVSIILCFYYLAGIRANRDISAYGRSCPDASPARNVPNRVTLADMETFFKKSVIFILPSSVFSRATSVTHESINSFNLHTLCNGLYNNIKDYRADTKYKAGSTIQALDGAHL